MSRAFGVLGSLGVRLNGAIVYARNGRDFTMFRVRGLHPSLDGMGLTFVEVAPDGRERVITADFPNGALPGQAVVDDADFTRLALVAFGHRRHADSDLERFTLQQPDVERCGQWVHSRSQGEVVHDVLSLLCEATIAGLCVAGREFRVASVLASVRGDREQVYQAIEFLVKQLDVGFDSVGKPIDGATGLFLNDFWTSVRRLRDLRAAAMRQ